MSNDQIFIAYASPDGDTAMELSWQLQDLEVDVFIDRTGIKPGDPWSPTLVNALNVSRIVAVLVSKHSSDAHYQSAEIARAIREAREPDANMVVVIPILLTGADEKDLPYGLEVINAIDGRKAGGMTRVARDLEVRLRELPPLDGAEDEDPSYRLLGSALNLDRVKQWNALKQPNATAAIGFGCCTARSTKASNCSYSASKSI